MNCRGCHHPRKRMIQYSRDASDGSEKPWSTGSPACAGDDDFSWSARGLRRALRCRSLPPLPVLVRRLALLDEGRHALGAVFQREGRMEQIALDVHTLRKRRLEGAVDGFLG